MACLSVLVFFLLTAAPTYGRDFWNIDCGGNSTITAANGLRYESDSPYIRTGVSGQVPDASSNGIPAQVSTLRAFPPGRWKKNCYRVPMEQGTKVLVRTLHYYGNYDGLNSPPNFQVLFDTAEFCDVTADSDLESWVFCEVVYVKTKKLQGTDICLVRTQPDQTPFVSAIEIRRLLPEMYGLLDFSMQALFMKRRLAFGAGKKIRYPDDAYNRVWSNNALEVIEGGGVYKPVFVKNVGVAAVNSSGIDNAPPALLFQSAAQAPVVGNRTTANNLTIWTPFLPSDPINIYLTMYFTDPISDNRTSATKKRAFHVYKDGEIFSNATEPIQPSYGSVSWFYASGFEATDGTTFDLVPAEGSTLPPVISGMELFVINDVANGTDSKDAEALSRLQSNFTVLREWTGDPCSPKGYNWEWVGCNYKHTSPPRINKLLLSGYQLSGNLPDFRALDALEVIDLNNNSLTGIVPEFLAFLPNLQSLDLSDNDFDSIPPSLTQDKKITLRTNGNPKLELQSASPPGEAPRQQPPANRCTKVTGSQLLLSLLLLATAAAV